MKRLGSANTNTSSGNLAVQIPSTPTLNRSDSASSGIELSGGPGGRTPGSTKNAELRKRLLAKRQSEREAALNTEDENEDGGGRGGPRSPARRRKNKSNSDNVGASSRDEVSGKESGAGDDSDSNSGNETPAGKTADDEDEVELCAVIQAQAWFPLQVLPQSRADAVAMHPLLALPVPQPQLLDPRMLRAPSLPEESHVLFGHQRGKIAGGDSEPLLSADGMVPEEDGREALPADAARAQADGLFVHDGPSLATVLLHTAESVPDAIIKATKAKIDPALRLARVTQRIVREMTMEEERAHVRKQYLQMKQSSVEPAASDRSSARSNNKENTESSVQIPPSAPAQAQLLKQLPTGAVLQVLENPLDERASTVVLPDVTRSVGGVLGNWGPDATIKERLGPLSVGHDKKNGSRSVLRLHVHQLALTEHPLMNAEERRFASLKSTFAVYRSLIEQHTLTFLSERMQIVVSELQRCLRLHKQRGEAGLDVDDERLLKALYANLCETLPLLTELRVSVDSLTSSIMEQWREIKDIRQKAGFTSTRANLTVRGVQGAGSSSRSVAAPRKNRRVDEEDGKEADAINEAFASDGWEKLAACLASIPTLVPEVQALVYAIEVKQLDERERAAAEAEKEEDVAKDIKKPPKPARNLPPAATGSAQSSPRVTLSAKAELSPRSQVTHLHGNYKRHLKLLTTAAAELVKCKCLMPEYVIRVDSDGAVTPSSQLDSAEQTRRAHVENTQFKAVVRVNGKRITETRLYPIRYPQLMVDMSQYFEFRVLREMDSLSVDIVSYTPACMGSEVFIASVVVPFPGQLEDRASGNISVNKQSQTGTHLYAPVMGWLSFSSEEGALSRKGGLLSSETSTLPPNAQVKGSILVACEYDVACAEHKPMVSEYDGVEESSLAVLPLPGATDKATAWGSGYTLGGGLSAHRLLPALQSMDPNDPRNDILAFRAAIVPLAGDRKVFHLFGHDFAVSFTEGGHSYDNYMRFKEGLRVQMLRLRDQNPYLFTEPIPLTDDEIRQSEFFRRILAQHTTSSPLLDLEAESKTSENLNATGTKNKLKSFLERVRNSSTAQARHMLRKTITTSSAVAETSYFRPLMEIDLENILPEKKRSLKPKPIARTTTAMHVSKASLLVQVVAARNIPLRSEVDSRASTTGVANSSMSKKRGTTNSPRRGKKGGDSDGYNSAGSVEADGPQISEALLDETKVLLRKRARTCVEVRFQEHRESTTSITGGAPLWKQSFSLPFHSPNDDYTPSALQHIRDEVVFSLFDEIEEDDSWRGTAMEGENTARTERRFLGSFSLPFNTIYNLGRVEGVFRLDTPLMNFGYASAGPLVSSPSRGDAGAVFETDQGADEALVHRPTFFETLVQTCFKLPRRSPPSEFGHFIHNKTADELEHFAAGDGSTYIKIMATLDPLLATLPEIPMDYSSPNLNIQDRPFGQYAASWIQEIQNYSQHTKNRRFKVFAMNSEGQHTLLCRYLTPQRPPEGFHSTRAAIQLVSQLPFIEDAQTFDQSQDCDFWCTTAQTLEIGAGDEEEHATLLYNYLYYFSVMGEVDNTSVKVRNRRQPRSDAGAYPSPEAIRDENLFLVMGRGVPEGDTVYVLMRDQNVTGADPFSSKCWLVINPCSGHVFSAMDPSCPLREIYCLVTPYNIWANLQYTSNVFESSFDVQDINMWRPFFGARLLPPAGGLQTVQDELQYTPTSATLALDVETAVLGAIKNSMRRWRNKRHRSTTTFHPDACLIMQDLLPKLERFKRRGNSAEFDIEKLIADAERKMAPVLRTRAFRGCPFNMPFTDVDDVVNHIKTLGVHETRHPEVQFVLAVKAIPMVNEIVSLWIFVGTLESVDSIAR